MEYQEDSEVVPLFSPNLLPMFENSLGVTRAAGPGLASYWKSGKNTESKRGVVFLWNKNFKYFYREWL